MSASIAGEFIRVQFLVFLLKFAGMRSAVADAALVGDGSIGLGFLAEVFRRIHDIIILFTVIYGYSRLSMEKQVHNIKIIFIEDRTTIILVKNLGQQTPGPW